jgi:glyoxylate reductase
MARVLVTRPMPDGGLEPLAAHEIVQRDGTWHDALAGADALMCHLVDRVDASVLASAPALRVVATVSVGYDNVDIAAAAARGIPVVHTPGVLDDATADIAFALILAARRRLSDSERALRSGGWTGWTMDGFLGHDVAGARLGLVGYGRIARAVARRAAGFDLEVRHHTRRDTGVDGWVADLDDLLRWCDVLSLHVPLTDATRHLIGARELSLLPAGAVVVNTARGPVLDEEALADALHSGALFGAGLDVYDGEPVVRPRLLSAPGVVLLPHVGSATFATRRRMAVLASEAVATVLAGGTPPNLVPAPTRTPTPTPTP